MAQEAAKRICDPGSPGGLFFGGNKFEHETKMKVRALVYLCGLLYMFMAVNISADYFMSAVERITARRRRIRTKEGVRTKKVWNDTIANLTLLALGSSAPEIMLSCIEIVGNRFHSGALGPGTIVGSAAFNLFVIIAVCVISIPDGECRAIKAMAVYHVTVIFSLIAYFWLLLIVVVLSPDIIELWEAIVTLLLFGLLLVLSYVADKGHMEWMAFDRMSKPPREEEAVEDEAKPPLPQLAPGDAAAGPARASTIEESPPGEVHESQRRPSAVHPRVRRSQTSLHQHKPQTAVRHSNKKDQEGITISDAEQFHERGQPVGARPDGKIYEGEKPIANKNGVVTFWKDIVDIQVKSVAITYEVELLRRNGATGKVTCKASTFPLGATPEKNFLEIEEEEIEFEEGETSKTIPVVIYPARRAQRNKCFQLCLAEITGGGQFNPNQDANDDEAYLTFNIINAHGAAFGENCIEWCVERLINYDSLMYAKDCWVDQVLEAFDVDGDDEGEGSSASVADYIMHVITLPWKVFFAIGCPPPHLMGGWLLFGFALLYIGALTAFISDLASLFGCAAGMPDEITAISIVALGTSLPDMFASMTAAKEDPEADASIVNVTGSNSVNVFIGIGLPWTCASIYWSQTGPTEEWQMRYPDLANRYPAGGFVVIGGNLGFSVNLFVSTAIIALVVLRVRRLRCAGELGGPKRSKILCTVGLLMLWLVYITGSILKTVLGEAQVFGILVNVAAVLSIGVGAVFEYLGPATWEALWPPKITDQEAENKALRMSEQVVFLSAYSVPEPLDAAAAEVAEAGATGMSSTRAGTMQVATKQVETLNVFSSGGGTRGKKEKDRMTPPQKDLGANPTASSTIPSTDGSIASPRSSMGINHAPQPLGEDVEAMTTTATAGGHSLGSMLSVEGELLQVVNTPSMASKSKSKRDKKDAAQFSSAPGHESSDPKKAPKKQKVTNSVRMGEEEAPKKKKVPTAERPMSATTTARQEKAKT